MEATTIKSPKPDICLTITYEEALVLRNVGEWSGTVSNLIQEEDASIEAQGKRLEVGAARSVLDRLQEALASVGVEPACFV